MPLIHGGDKVGFEAEYGRAPLDFSANVSPLGLPQGVRRAVINALDTADAYPDPLCRALTAALAQHEALNPAWILCGNGAADLIFRLCYAAKPKTALILAPTFAEYEQALCAAGCKVQMHFLQRSENFAVTEALLADITPAVNMLFLCQPNNPTGQVCSAALLQKIVHRCAETGTRLVADECFVGFLDDPCAASVKAFLPQHNLVILKAFTKLYAMAGVRLGYVLTRDTALLAAMRAAGQPWAVSSLASAAGIAALKETQYVEKVRSLIDTERAFLRTEFERMGIHCMGGAANFIFFHTDCADFVQKMRQKGVLVRDCANYRGLTQGDCRVGVRTHAENAALVAAVREVLDAR